ncbi:MAG: energy transducer TonB [Acidobacteriota bacterium]
MPRAKRREPTLAGAGLRRTAPSSSTAALDAVKQWRFEPSTLGGRPVAVLYRVEVTFSLR